MSQGEVVLLLNSDTIVHDNAIMQTLRFLQADQRRGLVGCKLLNEDGSEQLSAYIDIRFPYLNLLLNGNAALNKLTSLLGIAKSFRHTERTLEMQQKSFTCQAVSGAFMMLKRTVIDQCGMLDTDFFMYSEETEWSRNRISKKFEIWYYAEAAVTHLGGKSSSAVSLMNKQSILSNFLYSYKMGWDAYLLSISVTMFNTICNVVALPLISKRYRQKTWSDCKYFFEILPQLVYDIPRYSRKTASRPFPLRIKELSSPAEAGQSQAA